MKCRFAEFLKLHGINFSLFPFSKSPPRLARKEKRRQSRLRNQRRRRLRRQRRQHRIRSKEQLNTELDRMEARIGRVEERLPKTVGSYFPFLGPPPFIRSGDLLGER